MLFRCAAWTGSPRWSMLSKYSMCMPCSPFFGETQVSGNNGIHLCARQPLAYLTFKLGYLAEAFLTNESKGV